MKNDKPLPPLPAGLYAKADDPWLLFFAGLLNMSGLTNEQERSDAIDVVHHDIYRLYAEESWKLLTAESKHELANRIAKVLVSPKTEQRIEKQVARIVDGFIAHQLASQGDRFANKLSAKLLAVFEEQIDGKVRRAVDAATEAVLQDLKLRLTTK
jgi:hypothetical protein